jgi:hypothetical protein
VFSLLDSAYGFNFLIDAAVKMIISATGVVVNDSIQIISQESPSFAKKKTNASGQVLKTFDMNLSLPNDDLSFSLSNSAQSYKTCNSNSVKMIISASGIDIDGNLTINYNATLGGSVSCTHLNATGNAGIGVLNPSYKCHIKTTLDNLAKSFHLDAGDISDPDKYALSIWAFSAGGNKVGWKFTTRSPSNFTTRSPSIKRSCYPSPSTPPSLHPSRDLVTPPSIKRSW